MLTSYRLHLTSYRLHLTSYRLHLKSLFWSFKNRENRLPILTCINVPGVILVIVLWVMFHDKPTAGHEQIVFNHEARNGIHGGQWVRWTSEDVFILYAVHLDELEHIGLHHVDVSFDGELGHEASPRNDDEVERLEERLR